MSTVHLVLFEIVGTLIAISNILSNSFLIYALYKLKRHKTISFAFLLMLSIADTCLGFAQLPLQFSLLFLESISTRISAAVFQLLIRVISKISGGMICIIAVDRYLHINYLMNYNIFMNKSYAWKMVVFNITFSCLDIGLLVMPSSCRFYRKSAIALVLFYIICLFLVVFIYIKSYRSIQKRRMGIRNRQQTAGRGFNIAGVIAYVLSAMIIAYLPSLLLELIKQVIALKGQQIKYLYQAAPWAYLIAFSNSSCNSLILIFNDRQLRRYTLHFFRPSQVVPLLEINKNSPNTPAVVVP